MGKESIETALYKFFRRGRLYGGQYGGDVDTMTGMVNMVIGGTGVYRRISCWVGGIGITNIMLVSRDGAYPRSHPKGPGPRRHSFCGSL